MSAEAAELKEQILQRVREYTRLAHASSSYAPGDPIPISGRTYDEDDVAALVDAALDFWLTAGPCAEEFEAALARVTGTRYALMTNSGSSANLVAVATLCSSRLEDAALRPGDEVVTSALGFPTTVAPMLQYGLRPVFVDIELGTYNPPPEAVEEAVGDRTRAVMLAHTLGNPFDAPALARLASAQSLQLVEDCCDALGGRIEGKRVGTFGALATLSFYPAHHITTGEGGAVLTRSLRLKKIAASIRDWGRDCWCAPGEQNTCLKRFGWQKGELPHGYDHKYTYSDLGYNLKGVEVQAAVGVSQLHKLPEFVAARKANFKTLRDGMADLEEYLVLPRSIDGASPSWFGFPVTVRASSPINRKALVRYLEDHGVATRPMFGGNLTRQPAFIGRDLRAVGELRNADDVMRSGFWVGVYPGISKAMADQVVEIFHDAFTAGR